MVSDLPPTSGDASVVLDTHATVRRSHLSLIASVVVVIGLVVFTVVYFAVRDHSSTPAYRPGIVGQAVEDGLHGVAPRVRLSADELQCIDHLGAGFLPSLFTKGTFNPLAADLGPKALQFAGGLFDQCLTQPTRVEVFSSLLAGGRKPDRRATCLGTALDSAVLHAGGYSTVMTKGASTLQDMTAGLVVSLISCGLG